MLPSNSRVAYIKNGDVVLQLERMGSSRPKGGPDAFLADFLSFTEGAPTLLLSKDRRDACLEGSTLTAQVIDVSVDKNALHRVLGKFRGFFIILFKLLRFKPDFLVCGCLGAPLWACYLAARFTGATFVHSRHVDSVVTGGSRLRGLSYQVNDWIVRRATGVVCHGPYTRAQLLDVGVQADVLHEFDVGYPPPDNVLSLEQLGHADLQGKQLILYLGRVHADKGIFDLLDAARQLLATDSNRQLVVVGAGPGVKELEQRVASAGLQAQVQLIGQVPHPHVAAWLSKASVVVTPTRHAKEGRCLTAMEAMVCGVPVIAPNGGPFPFLVEHEKNGLLYEVDSTVDLQQQLTTLLDKPDLRADLAEGASRTGEAMREPIATFGAAIAKAFGLHWSSPTTMD